MAVAAKHALAGFGWQQSTNRTHELHLESNGAAAAAALGKRPGRTARLPPPLYPKAARREGAIVFLAGARKAPARVSWPLLPCLPSGVRRSGGPARVCVPQRANGVVPGV
jgi:hypothetical protein